MKTSLESLFHKVNFIVGDKKNSKLSQKGQNGLFEGPDNPFYYRSPTTPGNCTSVIIYF